MSLTRQEWLEVWDALNIIKRTTISTNPKRTNAAIDLIKGKV